MSTATPKTVDLTKYIDTHYFGERPHIRGRRVPVATIAYNARTNRWTASETAYNFGLTEAEVLAALLYYQEHAEEIDAQEATDQAQFDEMYRLQRGED